MKIGMIAMSGIRACDQELLDMGLTLPGFVERSKTIASLPSLGLLTLAGMSPGHQVSYFEVPEISELPPVPDFDLVAISSLSAQIKEAYGVAQRYRAMGIPVVMGGLHVNSLPQEAAQFASAVVVGEGEASWSKVLEDAAKGRLQRFYGAGSGDFDLRQAPMPAFELLDISKYNRITVQTCRGCPHCCEFCASSVLLTSKYKQKPVEKVLQEIDRICSIWDRPFIEFADDNSFINRRYWKELLPQLERRKIRWFTETDLSVSEDDELLEMIHRAGCAQVLIGLESPVDDGLHGIEIRNDWKLKRRPRYIEAIRRIQSHGITVNGCFVLGLDGHTPEVFDKVFSFVEESGLYEVQVTIQTAFPGTPLYHRLKQAGRIIEDGCWEKCTLFDINFRPQGMTVQELDRGFKNLVVRLYSKEFTDWRRSSFKRRLRGIHRQRREVPALIA
jgi:radical SAM superfamily enzyme YgiQ (UPF0313 family)